MEQLSSRPPQMVKMQAKSSRREKNTRKILIVLERTDCINLKKTIRWKLDKDSQDSWFLVLVKYMQKSS